MQLLKDFVDIDMLKDVTSEDIEDITERFVVMGIDSKGGDTVKKIKLGLSKKRVWVNLL